MSDAVDFQLRENGSTLIEQFRARGERQADRVFIRYFDGSLTYGETLSLAKGFADHLTSLGAEQDERVALILQNVPDFAIATLGAWLAGCAVLPINPMYKDRELTRLFADATPRVVVCHDEQLDQVWAALASAGLDATVLVSSPGDYQQRSDARVLPSPSARPGDIPRLHAVYARRDPTPSLDDLPNPTSERLALLLYTSGTTGLPKGAMLTHGNLAWSSAAARQWFGLGESLRVLACAPLFHITGFVLHLGLAIAAGGELCLTYRFHPEVVLDAMVEHRPTFTIAPITAYFALQNSPSATRDSFASFEILCAGGAAAPAAAVTAFQATFGKALLNGYGMTELAGASHFPPRGAQAPTDPESGALSIGVPVFGMEARIVADDGEDVASGVAGELLLRGPQVMQGYWHRETETAAAFDDGWLRTGDVAKMDGQNWFYLIDRKRDMINASGFKVWPREVEDVLYAHPAVLEAAVFGVPDAYRGETVKAAIAIRPGYETDPASIIAHCREQMAAYKVPRIVEILPTLPKTASGKVSRAELRLAG